jgi:hypothetical protein
LSLHNLWHLCTVKFKKITGGQLRKSIDRLADFGGLELKFTHKKKSGGMGMFDIGSGRALFKQII